jgi:hypothetical protein
LFYGKWQDVTHKQLKKPEARTTDIKQKVKLFQVLSVNFFHKNLKRKDIPDPYLLSKNLNRDRWQSLLMLKGQNFCGMYFRDSRSDN